MFVDEERFLRILQKRLSKRVARKETTTRIQCCRSCVRSRIQGNQDRSSILTRLKSPELVTGALVSASSDTTICSRSNCSRRDCNTSSCTSGKARDDTKGTEDFGLSLDA